MADSMQTSQKAKGQRKEIFKRAEQYVKEYRQQVRDYLQLLYTFWGGMKCAACSCGAASVVSLQRLKENANC